MSELERALQRAHEARRKHIDEMIAKMKAVLEDPDSSETEKELARQYLEGMDMGQAS
jgi:hypothetical protein